MSSKRTSLKHNGFALVVALMLMILLTVVAVGLLSLSTIALRSSVQSDAAAIARSNARMALMLAIGDLQKFTGPDKRITASASILQRESNTAPPNDKWVGAWRTDELKSPSAASPFLKIDTRGGSGYSDLRGNAPPADPAGQCLGWLVSGTNADPKLALPANGSVEVRTGKSPIRVPKVTVSNRNQGAFAYFVSDESTKAKISLADPYAPEQPDSTKPGGRGMNRWIAPQSSDASVFFKGTPLTPEESSKVTSRQQLELSSITKGQSPKDVRDYGKLHDENFTVHGRSVLSDPLNGGLKSDLTAYLEGGATPALGALAGITDTKAINGDLGPTRAKSGPKFGMLRNWYALRKSVTGSDGQFTLNARTPTSLVSGGKLKIVDPGAAFTDPLIQPVMTEAVYYLNHVLELDSSGTTSMVELIYPRVVLWNPFTVKLKTEGHIAFFDFSRMQTITCEFEGKGGKPTKLDLFLDSAKKTDNRLGFFIPPTEFAPGEALVFCAPTKSMEYKDSDLRGNLLSAEAGPANLGCFIRRWPKNSLGTRINSSTVKITYGFNKDYYWNFEKDNGRTQTITLHALPKAVTPLKGSNLISPDGPVAVRQISLDNYSRGNNGRWLPEYTKKTIPMLPDVLSGNTPPDSLLAYGGRFRFLYETFSNRTHGQPFNEPWFYSPLAHHNINAPNIHRWPNDNIFGLRYNSVASTGGNGPHLYSFGNIAQARQWSEWLDTEVMPHRGPSGKYRTAVFGDASFSSPDSIYPIYDIPLPDVPLVSLGTLQHVSLSPFAWHPTHVIGNSIPSPFVPLANATSFTKSVSESLWNEKTKHLNSNNDITGFSQIPDEVLLNDLSFELNQALWDRYFLSAIPRTGEGWKGNRWDPSIPFPNSRIKINPILPSSAEKSELLDFRRAARSLWLDGGFNIHSTQVDAWKSLLTSFRSVQVPSHSKAAATTGDGAAFPGFGIAPGAPSDSALDASRENFWRDYRKLSDDEIDALARAIVEQVRKRAPFTGVADFVNRRLMVPSEDSSKEYAFGGVIQLALDKTPVINDNGSNNKDLQLPTAESAATFVYGADYWGGPIATPAPQSYDSFQILPDGTTRQKGIASASQITQADILQQIGSVLVARGDTFVVRAYGEAKDAAGKIIAKAWCEAVVQRTPVPLKPDPSVSDLNPLVTGASIDWGRRYEIESFRWLNPGEI